jgi:hypothetical protein
VHWLWSARDAVRPNPLKGNWLCQRLQSLRAAWSLPFWALAWRRPPSAKGRTSLPSILTRVQACRAGRCRSMDRRRPIRSSTQSAPLAAAPAAQPSTPGRVVAPWPPIRWLLPRLAPGAMCLRAMSRRAMFPPAIIPAATSSPGCRRRRPATTLVPTDPTCQHRRPGQSRAGSWPFPKWATPSRRAEAIRRQRLLRRQRRRRSPCRRRQPRRP